MKRVAVSLGALMAVASAASADDEWKNEPWRVKAVEVLLEEPTVSAALWSQEISFWIAVPDDGSNRRGFAEYTCLLLNKAGKPEGYFVSITVLDQAAMLAGDLKQLGKAPCG